MVPFIGRLLISSYTDVLHLSRDLCTYYGLSAWCTVYVESKSNPVASLVRSWEFQEIEAPRFQDSRHIKMIRLAALRTGRLYPPGNIPGTNFCYRLSQPQGHSAVGRITSMKNSNDTIGNRTRSLPQPTAPPHAPTVYLEKAVISQLVKTFPTFTEPEKLPCSLCYRA